MPEARLPGPGTITSGLLRICPDCGGILEPSKPRWATMVNIATGTREPQVELPRWQCLICGYQQSVSGHLP